MKIKTITCHEVYNHGASLQEYALLAFLNQNGFEAATIHYKPPYLSHHFKLNSVSPKFDKPLLKQLYLLLKLPGRLRDLKRKKAFDSFAKKYIPTDSKLYTNNEELQLDLPEADAFICGSDQIWNSFFQNGKDAAFYLDFVPVGKLKISYAASFAIDSLEDSLKPFVKEKVSKIDFVSVRETSGVRILNELGLENAIQVLDPVFLIDADHWKTKFVTNVNSDYIFIYDFDSNPMIEKIAKNMATQNNLKIFTVNSNINYADQNFYLDGPEKFLSLMYHAKFVITNSFHSVAFSLIFEKQFVVVNRTEAINTRMRDLLGLFGLNNLLVSKEKEVKGLVLVDYATIQEQKEKAIDRSKFFLMSSLQSK
ncbi:polysaccharide pyruvyl transferase family protein [Flavobacterium sp. SUN046]|uniref:polysaccharide pyruvyl transferase family protein n=1 Tax=Flavobacterium sp. SUN046 TaxID=3002440 RepID=UPI002DB7F2E3|nr:polysaccharide pyruvyl transferase family protein [Flavobacterium sp. SUN046]MEC4050880.1 polysaccharide pyruvyl transferase family protein [Flavobacterium sp. SUN046]